MSKQPTISTISSGFYSTSALNVNFENIRDQFDNTLSLDGSTPNAMTADLDLNSNNLLNGGTAAFTSLNLNGTLVTPTGVDPILSGVSSFSQTLLAEEAAGDWLVALGLTANATEINYTDGVTSNIQTQLDAKQPLDATLTALAGLSTGANKVPYSTGTDTFGQLDFVDEDDMASDSATAVPSQQSIKAYVDSIGLGVGQTWQDVSGSRAHSTSYQNTTGKPIQVSIHVAGTTRDVQVSSDNATWVSVGRTGVSGAYQNGPQFVVPNGHYYRINGSTTIDIWSELR